MLKVGGDPELILKDGDRVVSAIGRIRGTKGEPAQLGNSVVAFPDNTNVEFNFAPASSEIEFVNTIKDALQRLSRFVSPYRIEARAASVLDDKELEHPEARIFGCDPEFTAWDFTNGIPKVVEPPSPEGNKRTCGGHVHAGWSIADVPLTIRSMDFHVGIPSVLMNNDPTASERNDLYGGAGKFRLTPYGCEYRSLDAFWITNPKLAKIIYNLTIIAVLYPVNPPADVAVVIDKHDKAGARWILDNLLRDRIGLWYEEILQMSELPHGDIYKNWGIA